MSFKRPWARVAAGAAAILLAAAAAFVSTNGGSDASAHAQPARAAQSARAVAQVHAIVPLLAPAVQRRRARIASRARATGSVSGQPSAAARASAARSGAPSPAPTRRSEALALRQATGLSLAQVTTHAVCPRATAGHATCAAQRLVLRSTGAPVRPRVRKYDSLGGVTAAGTRGGARPAGTSSTPPPAGTPAYLEQAYDLAALSQTGGTGDTVAVVDAYDDPTAGSDMATYRSTYGLPACSFSSGCLRKVGQTGTSTLPVANSSWEQEISLDLEAVSSVCPNCHILLVEANSNGFSDLEAAMQTAASLGADQISASWGGISNGVPSVFRTFAGVATVAATGDTGYVGPGVDSYPAALPGVTAAGGTSLAPASSASARGFGEGAWSWNGASGGSSGCDLQFQRPAYQPAMGCAGRAYADMSADADPTTGLEVYENGSWIVVGGTSLSTPLIAAYYAVTGVDGTSPEWAYSNSGNLNDIVSGSTGNCPAGIAYICNAQAGYDGPTGVGSISGAVVTGAPGIGGPSIPSGNANTYTAGVSAHGATISAGIYRNGLDTTWSIQYGTSTAYGSRTPSVDVGAGSTPVAVTGYLSQLTPATTYHYRLVATNSAGTSTGYDYTFTTPTAPTGQPTAAFTVTPSPGGSVSFDGSSSTPSASITDYSWNFGDGTPVEDDQATATTTHTYAHRGTYTVTLTVTSNGQSDTSTQSITVDDPPTAKVTPSALAVPADTTVTLNGSGSIPDTGGSIADYSWSFGDTRAQDTGSSPTVSHTFTTPGSYTVTLTTTDDLGVTSTATVPITVADFTASPSIPAPGQQVTLTAINPGPAGSTYTWDFGDSSPPQTTTTPSVQYSYAARGSYDVSLTINSGGTSGPPSTGVVNVDTAPTAAFNAIPGAVSPENAVSFDAGASTAADGNPMADYSWNFGDGTPTKDPGPTATASHKFVTPGIYTVTLTTTDDLGGTATTNRPVIVDQPTAAFMVSPNDPVPNAAVSFDASMASDPESTITAYRWNFGDGTPAQDAGASAIASHTFTNPGTYTVTLTVTDQFGFTDASSQQVVVDVPPIASFAAPSTPLVPGSSAAFDASASSDATGTITGYSWKFGDGSSGTGVNATHTYASRGSYHVTLTVINDAAQTATITHTVTVDEPPTAAFTPSSTVTTRGTQLSFNGTQSTPGAGGTITDYKWNFGDGTTDDTGTTPTDIHSYGNPGAYTVTLTTTDDLGVSSTATEVLTVTDSSPISGPQLLSLSYTPSSVNVSNGSASVTFTEHLTDGSNITGSELWLNGPSGQSEYANFSRISGTAQDGIWQATITVPQGAAAGSWNYQVQGSDGLNNFSYGSGPYGFSGLPPGAPGALTVTDSSPISAPQLLSLSYTPSSVDVSNGSASVTFTEHLTDGSNITGSELWLNGPSGQSEYANFSRISGTAQDGIWQATITVPQGAAAGSWNYQVQGSDGLNNFSYGSGPYGFSGLPPGAPGALTVTDSSPISAPQLLSLSYTPSSVNVSNGSASVTFTEHLTDGSNITGSELWLNGPSGQSEYANFSRISGTAQDGIWQATITVPQGAAAGSWNYQVQGSDGLNNFSYGSGPYGSSGLPPGAPGALTVTEGPPPPAAPTITSPLDGSYQNTHTVALAGGAEANSTIAIYDGATSVGSTTTNGSGQWSTTLSGVADGSHTYTATTTDAGGTSNPSTAVHITVDTQPPAAPAIASPLDGSYQNTHTVALAGGAEANSTIAIYDGATSVGSTTTNGSGQWSITLSGVADGSHTYTVTATDRAGNTSTESTVVHVTVDNVAPRTTITSGSTTQNSASFSFSSSKPGSTFECMLAGPSRPAGFVQCSSPIAYTNLAAGSYTFSVRATDVAGNTDVSPPSWSFVTQTSSTPPACGSCGGTGPGSAAAGSLGTTPTGGETTSTTPAGGAPPPVATLASLALSPSTFTAASSGPSASAARAKVGSTITFIARRPGIVRFTVQLLVPGRKASGHCVSVTAAKKGTNCTISKTLAGAFSWSGKAGDTRFHFSGRLAGHELATGHYRLVATSSTGQTVTALFRITA